MLHQRFGPLGPEHENVYLIGSKRNLADLVRIHRIAQGLGVPLVEIDRFEHEASIKRQVAQQIKALPGEMSEEELGWL